MCSHHERDREKENCIDKAKQGRKHDEKRRGGEKSRKKKFLSLTEKYQNKITHIQE